MPAGRSGSTFTPNVGQRGLAASALSKISIGKFESTPPSTSVCASPLSPSRSVTGWKNSGIEIEATVLYAGTCIFEGTALSEGRGTSAPMRIIGAPGVDGEKMLREFHARKLPGAEATPVYFDPTASKHRGELCGGLMLHVTDYETIRPVALGVELLDIFRTLYPEQSVFNPPYNPGGRRGIELLTGRGDFVTGFDKDKILSDYARESESFRREKAVYHMY